VATNLQGFDWDDNQFSNNQIAHPYHGSLYFNAARSNGFGYWEAWPFAFLGSWTWEYFGETYRPAYNDWLNTSLGGIALGEMLYRASWMVLDNTATGSSRTWKEVGAALLNPVQGFTRLVTGDWGKVGPNPADRLPSRLTGRFSAGARWVGDRGLDQTEGQGFLELGMIYGDPFDPAIRKPFDAFDLYLQLSSNNVKPMSRLQTKGILAAGDLHRSDKSALVVGGFHHFDYMNTAAGTDSIGFEYGGQAFGAVPVPHGLERTHWRLGSGLYERGGLGATDIRGTGRSLRLWAQFAYKAKAICATATGLPGRQRDHVDPRRTAREASPGCGLNAMFPVFGCASAGPPRCTIAVPYTSHRHPPREPAAARVPRHPDVTPRTRGR
jgi:hypothetical protein